MCSNEFGFTRFTRESKNITFPLPNPRPFINIVYRHVTGVSITDIDHLSFDSLINGGKYNLNSKKHFSSILKDCISFKT